MNVKTLTLIRWWQWVVQTPRPGLKQNTIRMASAYFVTGNNGFTHCGFLTSYGVVDLGRHSNNGLFHDCHCLQQCGFVTAKCWPFYTSLHEFNILTHWGRVMHIYVSKLPIIGLDNGLSPGRCQAIIGTNVWILLIGSLGTNFSQILIKIYTFSFKKMHREMSSGKWWPSCLGLNVLRRSKNGRHFPDDNFKWIFLKGNVWNFE